MRSALLLYYKGQVKLAVCNELTRGTVGWLLAPGTVSFTSAGVRIRNVHNLFFAKFFPFVSCLRVGLASVLGLARKFFLVLDFDPSPRVLYYKR